MTDRERRVTFVALGLLAAALCALWAGRFIQLDDTSGFGSNRWIMPLGVLATFLAVFSVVVASGERVARRSLGAALVGLSVALVFARVVDDGFRFIWGSDEGELLGLQVLLVLLAALLLVPRFQVGGRVTGWGRLVGYVTGLVLAAYVAFLGGVKAFESRHCSAPDFGGECDLAFISGLGWVLVALVVGLVVIVVVEVRRRRMRPAPELQPS